MTLRIGRVQFSDMGPRTGREQHGRARLSGGKLVVSASSSAGTSAATLARWSEALASARRSRRRPRSRRAAARHLPAEVVRPVVSSSCWLSSVSAAHQLEHDLLQVALPAVQVLDLGLQAGDSRAAETCPASSRVRSLARSWSDLLHVALGPGLSRLRSPSSVFGRHQGVLELDGPGFRGGQLFDLGEAAPAVVEAGELGVQVGQFEQAELDLRDAFTGPNVVAPDDCVAW